MESLEEDIKPIIPVEAITDTPTVPVVGKLKHSRYEDVWPEDVHAAFMEAVALYPPMGKRRLKYYRVSTHEDERSSTASRAKSFGRCQLIQSYILEKTGKNRSRKQVSSHLQRLKKIHKDNPAMQPLFSERSQPSAEHRSAQQVTTPPGFTDGSISTRHLKLESDLDLVVDLQVMDNGATDSSTFTHASEGLPLHGDSPCNALNSTDFYDQLPMFSSTLEFLSPVSQQYPAVAQRSSDSDHLPELRDVWLFEDAMNERTRSGLAVNTTSAFPQMPTCRLSPKLPTMQGRLADPSPTTYFPRSTHSVGFQPMHQWIPRNSWMHGVSCNSNPLTSVQDAFHTPLLPFQLIPPEKRRLYQSHLSEWLWPKTPDLLSLDPREDPREDTFSELRLRYPATTHPYDPSCPELGAITPMFNSYPSEAELSQISRLSHSYALTSPATASESISNGSAIEFLRQPLDSAGHLASPLMIRPTPVYPISYIHSVYSDSRTLAAESFPLN